MLCSCLEEGVEKQESVINTDMPLKSDSDANVKFKYQATNLLVAAHMNMQPDIKSVQNMGIHGSVRDFLRILKNPIL